jgi:hypothetical protein
MRRKIVLLSQLHDDMLTDTARQMLMAAQNKLKEFRDDHSTADLQHPIIQIEHQYRIDNVEAWESCIHALNEGRWSDSNE